MCWDCIGVYRGMETHKMEAMCEQRFVCGSYGSQHKMAPFLGHGSLSEECNPTWFTLPKELLRVSLLDAVSTSYESY